MNMLRLGDRGPDVAKAQVLVGVVLGRAIVVDGVFGPKTQAAVEEAQGYCGLAADGCVGPELWAEFERRIRAWLIVAVGELDVREVSGDADNPRIVEYHATTTLKATDDETPWCASYVNWVMQQAGYVGTRSAAAKSWLSWGAESGLKPGAIVVIKRRGATGDPATGSPSGYHVAFYVGGEPGTLRLLGGNQGNRVCVSSYLMDRYEVKGCRVPEGS